MRPALLLAAALLLAGCGTQATAPEPTRAAPSPAADPTAPPRLELPEERPPEDYPMGDPPRFHVLTENGQIDLRPWTICALTYCADGFPDDENLPDVGAVDHLAFGFDLSDWEFQHITFRELDVDCPRTISVEATRTGERTFRIDPAGPAGRWAVDIFGRGPDGDAVTTVEWTTRSDGSPGPPASGVAAVLADHDGELDSYGVEVALSHLDRWYDDAEATITVTSADGRSVTIPVRAPRNCDTAGNLFFHAPDDRGREATALGEGPFTYTAEVVLGGRTYTGTGSWPDDQIKGYAPNVKLAWDPLLPGYAGRR